VGKPNSGKSTLLNVLLNEERAIVSEIAGTTRDTVEDEVNIGGVSFRFIDTADFSISSCVFLKPAVSINLNDTPPILTSPLPYHV